MVSSISTQRIGQSLYRDDKKNVELKRKKQRDILSLHGWEMLSASYV